MENIKNQKDILTALASCKLCMRKVIIEKADKKLIQVICECVLNMLSGNLDINTTDLNKLRKYKHIFRKLIQKSNLKTKKKILVQHGGFLQYLLPAVITGISSIVSSLISKPSE